VGFCEDEDMVRVDFFRPGGKWYTTEAVRWLYYDDGMTVMETFKLSLKKHLNGRLDGMTAVCLEPYHVNAYPVMVTVGS